MICDCQADRQTIDYVCPGWQVGGYGRDKWGRGYRGAIISSKCFEMLLIYYY